MKKLSIALVLLWTAFAVLVATSFIDMYAVTKNEAIDNAYKYMAARDSDHIDGYTFKSHGVVKPFDNYNIKKLSSINNN